MKHGKTDSLRIKNFLGGEKSKKIILFAVILLLVIIVLYDFFPKANNQSDTSKKGEMQDTYISDLEEKLKNILSDTNGVGSCEIVITAAGGTEYIYATETSDKNQSIVNGDKTQIDSDSKVSVKTVTDQRDEKPLIEKEVFPEIQGVVIICEGGNNSKIKSTVTNIASTLLGVTKDKIVVEEKR